MQTSSANNAISLMAALDRVERGKDMLLNLFRRFDPLEMDAVGPQSATTLRMLEASLADAAHKLAGTIRP